MLDLTTVTATELSSLYQAGAASPVTVAQQVLAKIERVNPVLNAFCFTDPDTTLAQAQASAQRWHQGQPLSDLDGVPVSIKDSILTKGWPTLRGSRAVDPAQPWQDDDPIVEKLRSAGAVLLGKTTTPEFNYRNDYTYSLLNGTTYNPWDIRYSPGGTSGGAAAAVSAGLGPVAIGSDNGGSITQPAAFCGIVGFKPSGTIITGVLARSVADAVLVKQIYNNDITPKNTKNLKILYWPNAYYNETLPYVDRAVEQLKANGHSIQVTNFDLDLIKIYHSFIKIYQGDLNKIYRSLPTAQQNKIDPYVKTKIKHQLVMSDHDQETLSNCIQYISDTIQSFDIVITASTTVTACRATKLPPEWYLYQKHKTDQLIRCHSFLWTLTSQPTVTVPIALADNGLPVGMQIIGTVGQDDLMLEFANTIQSLFPKLHSPMM
jgi:aspartyl-tRNA(Asn)/glutamyl-tRNA(Gln) amidotransferase subunit A